MPLIKPKMDDGNKIKDKGGLNNNPQLSFHSENSPSAIQHPKSITEIVLMQKTVIHVYPNGDKFIQKAQSSQWIQSMAQIHKQNAKDKALEKNKVLEVGRIEEAEVKEL